MIKVCHTQFCIDLMLAFYTWPRKIHCTDCLCVVYTFHGWMNYSICIQYNEYHLPVFDKNIIIKNLT